jgi:hypothetical protein
MGIGRIVTNVDEFLGVRERELIANGGHDRLLACVVICVAMWNIKKIMVTTVVSSPEQKTARCGGEKNMFRKPEQNLPLEEEESAEVELLPLKMEDIGVVGVPFYPSFFFIRKNY